MKTLRKKSAWCLVLSLAIWSGAVAADSGKLPLNASEIMLAAHVGVVGSRLITNGDMNSYFDPVGKARASVQPDYGVSLESRWNWVSLSVGGWYERVGQTTSKTTVQFPNNPFPHSLTASPWIDYLVFPLQAGFGAVGAHQSLFVHAGVYAALTQGSNVAWQVDGSTYTGAPMPTIMDSDAGWILGLEYALRLRRGRLLLDVGTRSSFSTIAGDMGGSARVATGSASLGYGFAL